MLGRCTAAFVLLLTLSVPALADDAARLRVATDPSFVPFEMMDLDSGEMVGFDIDVLEEIAKRAGFTVELVTMDFNGIIPALQAGSVDGAIAGITITEKREKVVDFSAPYYDSGLKLLVRSGDAELDRVEELEGKRVATKIGSTSYDYLARELGERAEIVPFPGSADMYMALMSGSVDAVFYDAPNVSYFAKTKGAGRVQVVGRLYEGQQYGLAFPDGSPRVDDVNAALAAMKEDGTLARIHAKWFGADAAAD